MQVPHLGALGVRVCKLDAAALAATTQPDEREHPLAVELAKLLGADPVVLPGSHVVPDTRSHRGKAVPFARFGSPDDYILDLGVSPTHVAEVGPFPFRKDRAHECEVLRH